MFKPHCLLLALTLGALPLHVHAQTSPLGVVLPDASIEAQTARTLNEIAPALLSRHTGNQSDNDKMKLALAFARLGRVEAGLRAVNAMDVQNPDVSNGGPLMRDEVLRIVARRRALIGKVTDARELALQIKKPRLRADALLAIARAQTRAGDVTSAQKTLFQTLPLVGQDQRAQMYIAVLFHRADERSAAKRLLQRVEKALPPRKPTGPFSQRTIDGYDIDSKWKYLSWALFETGEAEKGIQLSSSIETYNTSNSLRALLRTSRLDLAEKRVRQETDAPRRINGLLAIAWALRPTQPERAASLLQEAEESLQKLPPEPKIPARVLEDPFFSLKNFSLLFVASSHIEEGNEDKAKILLNEMLARSTPTGAASIRLYVALMPLLVERDTLPYNRPISLSRSQIERISGDVNAAIPDANINQFSGALPELLDAQIQSGALSAARQTLTLMEPQLVSGAIPPKQKSDDPNILNFALNAAKRWQQLGDTEHLHDYLNRLWNSPLARGVSPRNRAWKFLSFGFVEEGKRRLAALGIGPHEPIYQYGSLAYFEGRFNPKAFPAWIQNVRDPQKKLASLDSFSLGLIESRQQLLEEREFTLSAGGSDYVTPF